MTERNSNIGGGEESSGKVTITIEGVDLDELVANGPGDSAKEIFDEEIYRRVKEDFGVDLDDVTVETSEGGA